MEIRQVVRILVFGYFSFLPNLLSYWIAAVLPQVVEENLRVTNKEEISKVGGFFFSFYFFGILASALSWPYLLKVVSKKWAVLLGLFFQGLFTALTGQTVHLPTVYALRFLTGLFNNINTVGKDFIFEFAKAHYRQYAFSLKSCFTVGGIFVGPLLGYYIYRHYHDSLADSLMLLFWLYMLACVLFVIVFMIDMRHSVEDEVVAPAPLPRRESVSVLLDDEEGQPLVDATPKEVQGQRGIPEVLGVIWRNRLLRNFAIVYFLTNGIFTARNFITVFYLEAPWAAQGLGVSSMDVSLINFYSFFLCVAFLLTSPAFIPSRISYLGTVRGILAISMVLMLVLPLLRDVLPNSTDPSCRWAIGVSYLVSNFFNPKLFSPFVNFFMNSQVDRYSRTALNAITFITSVISAALMMTLVSPFLSISLYNPHFVAWAPWNKYFCFIVFDLLLAISLFFLRGLNDLEAAAHKEAVK